MDGVDVGLVRGGCGGGGFIFGDGGICVRHGVSKDKPRAKIEGVDNVLSTPVPGVGGGAPSPILKILKSSK